MKDAYPRNRMIAKALGRVIPELIKRYGKDHDCTKEQLSRTCADLEVSPDIYPYLCIACLSSEILTMAMTEIPNVNWEEVSNRAERMVKEYHMQKIPISDHFYESGLGMLGGRAVPR